MANHYHLLVETPKPNLSIGKDRRITQNRYGEFVKDGIANRPWDELKGQIYLGSDEFIEGQSAEAGNKFHEHS
jgi:hypothetical protein